MKQLALVVGAVAFAAACTAPAPPTATRSPGSSPPRRAEPASSPSPVFSPPSPRSATPSSPAPSPSPAPTSSAPATPPAPPPSSPTATAPAETTQPRSSGRHHRPTYPWHEDVVATTFWVGEIFANGPNGSQVISTYDDHWLEHYGGCDGVVVRGECRTERRIAANGYFPRHMRPKQNPFYLDLPYDDVNDPIAAANRARVIPWAHDPRYRAVLADPKRSLMKNHWVQLQRGERVCYGQVEDAGPGQYHDARYVWGGGRPRNQKYNGAGLDVSPALNGCLHFGELNGDTDVVRWRFVDSRSVPPGPWTTIVTRR